MSIKKLQDLLNTGSQSGREPQKLCTQSNKSPSFGHGQFSPMGTNLVSAVNRSPSYSAIPGVQNMFYHPLVKNQQETVCPSPMFQVPTKKNPQTLNSLFQGSRFTAVETNPTTNHSTMNGNNASSSINSLLNQLQPQFTSQPRNLEELLQRSFTSMPSGYQSPFTSSMQSPFMYGNNNQSSNPQPSIGSDLSKILNPMTLLETSLQNNNFLSNQSNKPSSNEAVNKALILQLADILKQESESKIKSAIAELILKYRALGLLNNLSGTEMLDLQSLINGTEAPQQNAYQFQQQQHQAQPQPQQFHQEIHPQIPQQSAVPLSNGFSMNAINRNDPAHSMQANLQMYKPNLQQTRVDNARKELFALNEIPIVHQQQQQHQQQHQQHQPAGPFQENTGMMQGSLFGSNQHHSHLGQVPQKHPGISPINTLNQEMDSLSINMNTHNFSNFGITSTISAPERIDDLVPEDLGSILKNKVPSDEELPGVYNKYERINKILKYKNKIRKWRREHPVKRVFKGRSVVAGQKPRIKGKFVTLEEYSQHLTHDYKEEYGNSIKEEEF